MDWGAFLEWFDLYGFQVIGITYVLLLFLGYMLMYAVGEVYETRKEFGRPSQGLFSGRFAMAYLVAMAVTGVPALFGSLMPWLPPDAHLVLGAAFALLFLAFPYLFAIDSLF